MHQADAAWFGFVINSSFDSQEINLKSRFLLVIAVSIVTAACRAHNVSRPKTSTSEAADTPQLKTFHGTNLVETCSITVTWDRYGITELSLTGPNLADFMLPEQRTPALAFIANTRSFSRWLEESEYGIKEQDKGFLPEYRLSHRWHLLTSGITYKFDAGWYLGQSIPGAPANKKVLTQSLSLDGTIDPLKGQMEIDNVGLTQLVSAAIPLPLGETTFNCNNLKAAR